MIHGPVTHSRPPLQHAVARPPESRKRLCIDRSDAENGEQRSAKRRVVVDLGQRLDR